MRRMLSMMRNFSFLSRVHLFLIPKYEGKAISDDAGVAGSCQCILPSVESKAYLLS